VWNSVRLFQFNTEVHALDLKVVKKWKRKKYEKKEKMSLFEKYKKNQSENTFFNPL
jgi:hypothetical protein